MPVGQQAPPLAVGSFRTLDTARVQYCGAGAQQVVTWTSCGHEVLPGCGVADVKSWADGGRQAAQIPPHERQLPGALCTRSLRCMLWLTGNDDKGSTVMIGMDR